MRYIFWIFLTLFIIFRFVINQPKYFDGDKIRISTKVTSEPIKYDTSQRLILFGLIIYLPRFPEIYYGDKVVIEGVVEENKLDDPKLISLEMATGSLYKTRNNIIKVYKQSLPEPHSSLLAGMTLGSKSNLPTDFWETLKSTGTAHVVVASGMNVTLVAGFIIAVLIVFLPRTTAIPLALAGIWLYAILSGFDAPIVRAAIMGSIAFTAQALGRLQMASRALFLSAALMLVVKPDWLTDLGFILSFIATASLMLFERKIASLLQFVPSVFREGLSTSLAAQIGVAPILYISFGQFNLLSPIINALVLWTVAPITIIGGLGGIIGLASESLGKLILYLAYPLTTWFISIVEMFG